MKTFKEFSQEILEQKGPFSRGPFFSSPQERPTRPYETRKIITNNLDVLHQVQIRMLHLEDGDSFIDVDVHGFEAKISNEKKLKMTWDEFDELYKSVNLKEEFLEENVLTDFLKKKGIQRPEEIKKAHELMRKMHEALLLELEKKKTKQSKRIAYSNNDDMKEIYSKNRRDEVIRKIQQRRSARERLLNPRDKTSSENRKQAVGGKKR